MSEPDSDPLSARDLMPAWLDDLEKPTTERFAGFEGGDDRRDKRGRGRKPGGDRGRDDRGGRPRQGGDRPRSGGGGGKGKGPGQGQGRGQGRGPRSDRQSDRGRGRGRDGGGRGRDRGKEDRRPRKPALEGVKATLVPEPASMNALAKYVRDTGRAYPMRDIAFTMLSSRDRYRIRFEPSGDAAPELVRCNLDGSLWLNREEALQHILKSKALSKYYRVEEVEIEPPRGNFPVIAVHRRSGTLLGPPNHHEYRTLLMKLHRERFSHESFDRFSNGIEMRRDEETIEAWKASKSKVQQYVALSPEEREAKEAKKKPVADRGESGSDSASHTEAEAAAEAPAEASVEEAAPVEADAAGEATEVTDAVAEETVETPVEGAPEAAPVAEEPTTPEAEAPAEESSDDGEPSAETEESSAEGAGEDADAEASEGESPAADEAEPAAGGEEADSEKIILKTEAELSKHLLEHHGDALFATVKKAEVPGNIAGRDLAAPLLDLLRNEVETRRQAPLTLIQELCRALEKEGVRFFKENKKLFVSMARPRRLEPGTPVADSVKPIIDYLGEHPRVDVRKLMQDLIPGLVLPKKGEDDSDRKPSPEEMQFYKDLRWLLAEGYVVEYNTGKVRLGGMTTPKPPAKGGAKKAKGAKAKDRSEKPRAKSEEKPAQTETPGAKREEPKAKPAVTEAVEDSVEVKGTAPDAAPPETELVEPAKEAAIEEEPPEVTPSP